MDHEKLRQATAMEHQRVEAMLPLMREDLSRTEYVEVLRRFYAVVSAWERWAEVHVPGRLRAVFEERKRAEMLLDDLHFFGVTIRDQTCTDLPLSADEPSFLGAMYVVEGSTLGGQFIARHVEAVLHLKEGEGDRYFRGYGEKTGAMWREVKTLLGDVDEAQTEAVIAGARDMFALFAEGLDKNNGAELTAAGLR